MKEGVVNCGLQLQVLLIGGNDTNSEIRERVALIVNVYRLGKCFGVFLGDAEGKTQLRDMYIETCGDVSTGGLDWDFVAAAGCIVSRHRKAQIECAVRRQLCRHFHGSVSGDVRRQISESFQSLG